jgi:hypothetical protein
LVLEEAIGPNVAGVVVAAVTPSSSAASSGAVRTRALLPVFSVFLSNCMLYFSD